MRIPAFCLIGAFSFAPLGCPAQPSGHELPDIGSSASQMISPAQERAYGEMTRRELRRLNYLLEDPLLDAYLQAVGYRLVANGLRPDQQFQFLMLRSREINAWATLGGYIAVNAGLILTTENESELAAVLAHEISHVTQRHIVRAVERAKKDQLPIALAMLGAIIAAQQSGGSSSDDATQAAIAGGMGLMAQQQINYTRHNEHEADRTGIQTLARAGYDPMAMAEFFGRMHRATRSNTGGIDVPEFLRTHPVNTTRISEAKDRARQMGDAVSPGDAGSVPLNPLLPERLYSSTLDAASGETGLFPWARERLRVSSAETPAAALREYERQRRNDPEAFDDASRYGLALAQSRAGQAAAALENLRDLRGRHSNYWLDLASAEALHQNGQREAALAEYARLLQDLPGNRAVALSYTRSLADAGTPEAGLRMQEILRPLLADGAEDAALQQGFARASELAGDLVRAGEAYAEAAFLSGRPEDALKQLEALKQRGDLDYYQRARVEARIAAMTPVVLEMHKQGIRAGREPPSGLTMGIRESGRGERGLRIR